MKSDTGTCSLSSCTQVVRPSGDAELAEQVRLVLQVDLLHDRDEDAAFLLFLDPQADRQERESACALRRTMMRSIEAPAVARAVPGRVAPWRSEETILSAPLRPPGPSRSANATYCWGSCCVVSGVRGQLANRRSGSWPPAPPRAAPGRVAPSLRERVPRCATRLGTALARRCRVSATACAEAAWLLAVARSL